MKSIYATAADTKTAASSAKRTSTAIAGLLKQIELTRKDEDVLLAAAAILSRHGARLTGASKTKKHDEAKHARAIEKARAEARQIIASWPLNTTLDKVALILGGGGYHASELNIIPRERDPAWHFQYHFDEQIDQIVSTAAHRSIDGHVSVANILLDGRTRLDEVRTRPGVVKLAAEWDARLHAQSTTLKPNTDAASSDSVAQM